MDIFNGIANDDEQDNIMLFNVDRMHDELIDTGIDINNIITDFSGDIYLNKAVNTTNDIGDILLEDDTVQNSIQDHDYNNSSIDKIIKPLIKNVKDKFIDILPKDIYKCLSVSEYEDPKTQKYKLYLYFAMSYGLKYEKFSYLYLAFLLDNIYPVNIKCDKHKDENVMFPPHRDAGVLLQYDESFDIEILQDKNFPFNILDDKEQDNMRQLLDGNMITFCDGANTKFHAPNYCPRHKKNTRTNYHTIKSKLVSSISSCKDVKTYNIGEYTFCWLCETDKMKAYFDNEPAEKNQDWNFDPWFKKSMCSFSHLAFLVKSRLITKDDIIRLTKEEILNNINIIPHTSLYNQLYFPSIELSKQIAEKVLSMPYIPYISHDAINLDLNRKSILQGIPDLMKLLELGNEERSVLPNIRVMDINTIDNHYQGEEQFSVLILSQENSKINMSNINIQLLSSIPGIIVGMIKEGIYICAPNSAWLEKKEKRESDIYKEVTILSNKLREQDYHDKNDLNTYFYTIAIVHCTIRDEKSIFFIFFENVSKEKAKNIVRNNAPAIKRVKLNTYPDLSYIHLSPWEFDNFEDTDNSDILKSINSEILFSYVLQKQFTTRRFPYFL